ncbi:MAG TPA: hypothetical protein DEG43_08480 [Acidimicrobiaceae bacterium]|nr:hypothetical protein [Acidimicrobiaceae bacterium]
MRLTPPKQKIVDLFGGPSIYTDPMCGRVVSTSTADELAAYFGGIEVADTVQASYNVAPTNDVAVVVDRPDARRLEAFRWGLIPSWAKDPAIGSKMINARSETVLEKPSFKSSFLKRRCIMPVDGFYEWQSIPGKKVKQPYFISRPDEEPYAFACMWSLWTGELAGETRTVCSVTILTTSPNETMSKIHHRMPVILPPHHWDRWLDPQNHDGEELTSLLVPAPNELISLRPISTAVNNVRNKGCELIEEVLPDPALFQD